MKASSWMVAWWFFSPTSFRTQEAAVARSIPNAPDRQFDCCRDSLEGQQGLPFLSGLSRAHVEAACERHGHRWCPRIYTPWITLGIFLSQVLSKDQSCDDAVERFQKFRYDRDLPSVSPETTSYCEARSRLPEPIFWDLARQVG